MQQKETLLQLHSQWLNDLKQVTGHWLVRKAATNFNLWLLL